MGLKGTLRALEAAERRRQREAQKRHRELERAAKEQAKLSALEQARLEVETYENQLELLLSVHKEQGENWDWKAIAASLPPPFPQKYSHHELKAQQHIAVLRPGGHHSTQSSLDRARRADEEAFERAKQVHDKHRDEWENLKDFWRRSLAGDEKAYSQALTEFNPFTEISELGSSIHFTVHSTTFIEGVLKVNGRDAIPKEVKTLTSAGKVSVKAMPKARFHEIYQDYLCGCVLRVAREVFARLPVDIVLLTAVVDAIETSTGQIAEAPVLSVVMPRSVVAQLAFDLLDPSDTMENFQRRGDLKASRKSETFQTITPLTVADMSPAPAKHMCLEDLVGAVQRLRHELKQEIGQLQRQSVHVMAQTEQTL